MKGRPPPTNRVRLLTVPFRNPRIEDRLDRVCRDPLRKLSPQDRLIAHLSEAFELGIETANLIKGVAAALSYDDPKDRQAAEMRQTVDAKGIAHAIKDYCKLAPDHLLTRRIADTILVFKGDAGFYSHTR